MDRTYDIFEVRADGALIWKTSVVGHEAGIEKLREHAVLTEHEVRMIHLPTKAVIATLNAPKP